MKVVAIPTTINNNPSPIFSIVLQFSFISQYRHKITVFKSNE